MAKKTVAASKKLGKVMRSSRAYNRAHMPKKSKKIKVVMETRTGRQLDVQKPMKPATRLKEIKKSMDKLRKLAKQLAVAKVDKLDTLIREYEDVRTDLEVVLEDVSEVESKARRLVEVDIPDGLYEAETDVRGFAAALNRIF